jgi:zinc protease
MFRHFAAIAIAVPLLGQAPEVDIPYEKFVLDNGLTVIVHEDHKAPVVAVNVWYHVGSKNERAGKTGFAHLFEHLMFGGSENAKGSYIQALQRVGATDLNGTTNPDRTNYFQNVPVSALDYVLFLESDRMGHMLGAIDQKTLDLQRGVVQNEKRQGENQPYGVARQLLAQGTYSPGHPYSWTTIGSMEDLNAASMEDVQAWFKTYYGPNNAVIALAGDIDVKTAREKVAKYFGEIPPGPPVAKHRAWIAKRTGEVRQTVQDRVPQARIYKVWNTPQYGTRDLDALDLVSDVLARGRTSRLYKRLVYDDQIATSAAAFVNPGEISGQFALMVTARPGQDLQKVEQALDQEMTRFLESGPTTGELERVKTQYFATFVRGIERIGGFGGKSDQLARNEVFFGRPDAYKDRLRNVREATPESLRQAARAWLSDGVYVLEVHPFPPLKTVSKLDRSKAPAIGAVDGAPIPKLQHAKLSNGLKVVLAERRAVPLVDIALYVDAGFTADQHAIPGAAQLTAATLTAGTRTRNALQISDELDRLGASLDSSADLDRSIAHLSALKNRLDESLAIFSDVLLNPTFPEADFERLRKQALASIQREKVTPADAAGRVMAPLIYGKGHPYGVPRSGSGTEESVRRLTRDDLAKFHAVWYRPNNATLIVAGDTTIAEITPKLETALAGWKPADVPPKKAPAVEHRSASAVYLVDRPGSQQSFIAVGHIAPPKRDAREFALDLFSEILGRGFSSRVNMNLREDKHWSYGAAGGFFFTSGQRPYVLNAPVQADKTKEAMAELNKELRAIVGDRPPTEAELAAAQERITLKLPGSFETNAAVASAIGDLVRFRQPDDYYDKYASNIRAVKLAAVTDAAKSVLRPDALVWVVVGDRAKIEPGIRELGLGEVSAVTVE